MRAGGGLHWHTALEPDGILPGLGRDLQPVMRAVPAVASAAIGALRRGASAALLPAAVALGEDRRRIDALGAAVAVPALVSGSAAGVGFLPPAQTQRRRAHHRPSVAGHQRLSSVSRAL